MTKDKTDAVPSMTDPQAVSSVLDRLSDRLGKRGSLADPLINTAIDEARLVLRRQTSGGIPAAGKVLRRNRP